MTTSAAPTHVTAVGAPGMPGVVAAANALVAGDKGLLAIDESIPTCNKRFARLGIAPTEHNRRAYRELIVATPGLAESISGVILYDETFRQDTAAGVPFRTVLADAGILAGIKADLGAKPMAAHPGEKVTEGLDGLRERLAEYAGLGARFAKWRAVFTIGETLPSRGCVQANAHALARYAALCQEADLVPIVEPEVLMAGEHTLTRCGEVTEDVLREVFSQLHAQGVLLEGILLKTNMVLPGLTCPIQPALEAVAEATICCPRRAVPAAVAGIVFLSGGQSGDLATARLNAINAAGRPPLPWPVAFSYGRAIQQPALSIWDGRHTNAGRAQHAIAQRAKANRDARRGEYAHTGILDHT
ncbi:class I fructose-bisphosphate aldolase [Candidatus Mycobacterium methanotrophicum]|uniref:Fructose-bisphosphate aldolase class I n=1 Tax=Candidatus Mycobacterium methanotrophicum TaxID=2943498 RepID=A0ABY4QS15_9MYCO|nr:class I fructose-bisphosphate aldolase [Candidatus Mycobacterium methanotrophicum]UQX12564.1 fructose-bisphosphate aldolase class I [Candidatus Mycobacterium methanotrophicum]